MEQAEHFQNEPKCHIYLCQCSLYDLQVAGKQWFLKLDSKLKDFGLSSLSSDRCVDTIKAAKGELIVIIYVFIIVCVTNSELHLKIRFFS